MLLAFSHSKKKVVSGWSWKWVFY